MPEAVYRFAEALRQLSAARTAAGLEARWDDLDIPAVGWEAVAGARRKDVQRWEPALREVDALLLRLLDEVPILAAADEPTALRVRTFRLPELERLQHATAAALVAQRYGPAGLRTVVDDAGAPLPRRYFAFLALAERHPQREWPLFARYLTPDAHHAFVGAAAEAARFYPDRGASMRLVRLFQAARSDLHLRAFLSPRILESLYVLSDHRTLPFFRGLLIFGFTHADPAVCEVTRALVMVRRFTGAIEPSVKFPDPENPSVARSLERAERIFERQRQMVTPVVVI